MQYNQNLDAKSNQWWRWPLVPIASIVGAGLGSTLFVLFQWFSMKLMGGFSDDGWMYLYILPCMSSATFGFMYIWIACYVAPRGKVITGIVMATILIIASVAGLLYVWSTNANLPTGKSIQNTIEILFTAIACVVSVLHANDEYGL